MKQTHIYIITPSDISSALDNLALAASNDSGALQKLMNTCDKLVETNKKLVAQLETLKTRNQTQTTKWDPNGYCWTHGYLVGKFHNSASCRSPAPGHKTEASKENRMEGSVKGVEQYLEFIKHKQ